MPPLRSVIVVSHTHWDREWYLPFEDFRWLLVKTLDQLIDLMEAKPEYRRFNLDGQTIILEDYLELRPKNRARLQKLIATGRIQIGPWYVLADEFLVSGESLIRNLLFGRRLAQEFGDIMSIGYVPDAFGHIAQLPQILRGFDIDASIWWRGLEDHGNTLPTELRWRAPDSSEVLLVHLRTSYSTAANLPNSVDAALAQFLMPLNLLSLRGTSSAALLMNGSDHLPPQPFIPDLLKALNQRLQSHDILKGKTVSQLMSEHGKSPLDKEVTGFDELGPFIDQLFTGFIKELHGVSFYHGTFKDYIDIIKTEVNLEELPVITGEQHASKYVPILPGVFSARLYLKQQNFASQQLLERWVEPFATIAQWLGAPYPALAIHRAWQLLLQNHPHDSICGCSVDATHADMERRFAWSQQIGNLLLSEAIHHINHSASSKPPSIIPDSYLVAFRVFNPHPYEVTDIIRILLQLPTPLDPKSNLALYTVKGKKIPFQMIQAQALDPALRSLLSIHDLPPIYTGEPQIPDPTHQILLTFVAPQIPGLGYTTFYLAADNPVAKQIATPLLSIRKEGGIYIIDNSFIQLQISTITGNLSLHYKPTQKEYSSLLVFEDSGDIGDEYNYCPPEHDLRIKSTDKPKTKIRILEQGPIITTLEVTTQLSVPQSIHKNRKRRSSQRSTFPLKSLITISAHSPRIDVQTTFNNTAEDHRLRVLFPTNINTNTAWGDTPFHVTERPLTPAPQEWGAQLYPMIMDYYLTSILKYPNVLGKPLGWFEDSTTTHALQTFLDVHDGTQGLLIATRGLPEFEVLDETNRTIALTLIRSVGWLSKADLTTRRGHAGPELPTPGAQCQGHHVTQYSILPHQDSWKNTSTLNQLQSYITPLKAIQLTKTEVGTLNPSQSFLSTTNSKCVFSCLKKAEDSNSTIFRIYELCGEPSIPRIKSALPITNILSVNLAEQPQHSSQIKLLSPNSARVKISPYQIQTIQLQMGSPSHITPSN